MAEPHNYRTVGYSMIMLSAALTVIALLYLTIGSDVLYSDHVSKEKQLEYNQMLEATKQQENATMQASPGKNLSVNLNEEMNMANKP